MKPLPSRITVITSSRQRCLCPLGDVSAHPVKPLPSISVTSCNDDDSFVVDDDSVAGGDADSEEACAGDDADEAETQADDGR